MVRFFIFINALLWTGNSIGQINNLARPPHQPTSNEIEEINTNCTRRTNKSFSERLKKYPFNLTTELQLVSFWDNIDTVNGEIEYGRDSLPRMNDTICYSKLYEIKKLTFAGVDKLTDIFYNYGIPYHRPDGKFYLGSVNQCYNPRNAILFLDKNGKAFEFIEICFECKRTRESSDKISLGQMCDRKLDMIKAIFKEAGIEYGITRGLSPGN
jgi:hypothetical protein